MCVSVDATALETIFGQWLYTYPNDYSTNLPEPLQGKYPNLVQVAAGKHVAVEPWTSTRTFQTAAGLSVQYIAKYSTWGEDFWEDLVAPTLGVNLYTETWQNGGGRLDSFCTSAGYAWDVENVLAVDVGDGAAFKETQDHSKWAVSMTPSGATIEEVNATAQWACVGDLNMQSGQESRAGGALCVQNNYFNNAYASLIASVEEC
jgi:deoxyribonuclease-2